MQEQNAWTTNSLEESFIEEQTE